MYSIKEIAEHLDGKIVGDSNLTIKGLCGITNGKSEYLSYIDNKEYFKYLKTTKASAIIVNNKHNFSPTRKTLIEVSNSIKAFSKIAEIFYEKKQFNFSVNKTAIISSDATLGDNIFIGHNVIIEGNVSISDNVYIGHGTYIGNNCSIGKNSILSNNATLVKNSKIGANVRVNSGTIIGGSGFGLFTENKKHFRIPHIGNVIIKDNVSIGSNCCIDRGTIDDTIIGENTQVDNLVQIAHNVIVGKGCIFAGQTGIAGSTIIGDFVTTGGQVGIVGHINIGDNVTIAGKSLVTKSILCNQIISGIPAKDHKKRIKDEATINRLSNIIKNNKNII